MIISVALCTYNGSKYISEQLWSVINQSQHVNEIIICDDNSTDNTVSIIQKIAETSTIPIKLVKNESQVGFIKNFEKAITLCEGEIIFLSDQDDVWMPKKIETIAKHFYNSEDLGLVFSDAEIVDENLKSLGQSLWDISFTERNRHLFESGKKIRLLNAGYILTGATMAFRAEIKSIILPIPEQKDFIHDAWIGLAISGIYRILPLPEQLIKYRQHSLQQMGIIDRSSKEQKKDIFLNKAIQRNNDFEKSLDTYKSELQRLKIIDERYKKFNSRESGGKINVDLSNLVTEEIRYLVEAIFHINKRMMLIKKNRLRRIPGIMAELTRGRYKKYSNGLRSAVKDLILNKEISENMESI